MKRVMLLCTALALVPAAAFSETKAKSLADVRAELSRLADDLQSLRSELVQGGAPAMQAAGGASALDRMNAMEAELSRLTSQTEQVQNKINRVVADGTNRVGDLEFRLCELEEGCDTSKLPITESLGGGGAGASQAAVPVVTTQPAATGAGAAKPELAVAEQADFDRAKAALDSGDFQGAADKFTAFGQAYPGSPLTSDVQYYRGEALEKIGDTANAARAYLQAFSGAPSGSRAPGALLRLGATLGALGQAQEACVTLGEVGTRFPTAPESLEAAANMRNLNCP